MRAMLDTHVLLWTVGDPTRLPPQTLELLGDPATELVFSAASIWEVVIKNSLGRSDFRVEPRKLRSGLIDHGYQELKIGSEHAIAVGSLPSIHRDPFDRILLAQAVVEDVTLFTVDPVLARYPAPVRLI
ncbi:MAG: type II toxin-antitoxin system VapC family toxin [Chloroflexota bacterium]|nr:type II toxin-antitoxin system VapC family toxin [Chloroflexota bacterium]MDE2935578.1 type II toxin-antitoxin system VapC family toxin [Chloroflexota bacterium]